MTIRGPDPDKSSYRFLINREVARWRTDLRARWIDAIDEKSAQEIDAEFERCLDPSNMDDATHARDTADFLKRHLDQLEHALKTREQLRANQAKYRELIASRDLPDHQEAMRRARANIQANAGQGLDPEQLMKAGLTDEQIDKIEEWVWHPLFNEASGQVVTLYDPSEGYFMGKPAVRARFKSDRFRGVATWVPDLQQFGYDPIGDRLRDGEEVDVRLTLRRFDGEMLSRDRGLITQGLQHIELVETDPKLLHTNFPELAVKVPKRLPDGDLDDLTDEERDEAQARLEHAQQLAGIYNRKLDDRDVRKVMAQDDQRAATNAVSITQHEYVNQWSDKPVSEPGKAPPERTVPCDGPVKAGHRCVLPKGHEGFHETVEVNDDTARRQEVVEALKVVYEAAGLKVERLLISEQIVHVKFAGRDPITTKLPEPLSKLLGPQED